MIEKGNKNDYDHYIIFNYYSKSNRYTTYGSLGIAPKK